MTRKPSSSARPPRTQFPSGRVGHNPWLLMGSITSPLSSVQPNVSAGRSSPAAAYAQEQPALDAAVAADRIAGVRHARTAASKA